MKMKRLEAVLIACLISIFTLAGCNGGDGGDSEHWVMLSTGGDHVCAVAGDGSLWCWGSLSGGGAIMLKDGLGTTKSFLTEISVSKSIIMGGGEYSALPVQIGSDQDWASVAAGDYINCAIKTNGTMWCWTTRSSYGPDSLVAGEGTKTLAEKIMTTWLSSTPEQIGTDRNWRQVSTGNEHACAVKRDNSLWCWGSSNSYGQLGIAVVGEQQNPVRVGGFGKWSYVSAGDLHTCARNVNGTLWCWGNNGSGQVGDGTNQNSRFSPSQVGGEADWFWVGAGGSHTCATKTNGSLWCWGYNYNHQLGYEGMDSSTPVRLGVDEDWLMAAAGGSHTCAVKTGQTLWCWGGNWDGQVGAPEFGSDFAVPVQVGAGVLWLGVEADNAFNCAMDTARGIWCWGANYSGQLGIEPFRNIENPSPVNSATDWTNFAAGGSFACALKSAGALFCWGSNYYGQLGAGLTVDLYTYMSYPVQEYGEASDWALVSGGGQHACAVKSDDTAYCWGYGNSGQLGRGGIGDSNSPVQATGSGYDDIAAGYNFSCATTTGGALWCWGEGSNGQMGNGTYTWQNLSPVQESTGSTAWESVAGGAWHACAIRTNDQLWCWGSDNYGQVGIGTSGDNHNTPQHVTAQGDSWAVAAAGYYHTCAIKNDGTLWCWGRDYNGQLGNATYAEKFADPQQAGTAADWVDVTCGSDHSCAIKADGSLWCWGANYNSQLGIPGVLGATIPVQVGIAYDWVDVEAGSNFTCARKLDGRLFCWGANDRGQIGQPVNVHQYQLNHIPNP